MMIQKVGGLLLVAVLVVGFLPMVNAAPIPIDDDSDTDSSGPVNSQIGYFEADDDATWLYFYISTPAPLVLGDVSFIVYIVDFYDPATVTYWRIWVDVVWLGSFIILSSGVDAGPDGATYFGAPFTLTVDYNAVQFDSDTILLMVAKGAPTGIPPTTGGYSLTGIYATTDLGGMGGPGAGATPAAPPAYDQTTPGIYGTQIPEFSTLLIPIIGTIALFAVFRKYKKK